MSDSKNIKMVYDVMVYSKCLLVYGNTNLRTKCKSLTRVYKGKLIGSRAIKALLSPVVFAPYNLCLKLGSLGHSHIECSAINCDVLYNRNELWLYNNVKS